MKRLMPLIASLGLAAVGCGELVAPAAATVADEKITIDEVTGVLEDCTSGAAFEDAARQSSEPELRKRIERGYLNRSIRLAIFESKADRLGVEVTDAEVDEQLDQIRGQFPNEEDLAARALQEAICIGEPLKDLVTLSLLEERLRTQVTEGLGPNEEELRTFYEENLRQFTQGIHTAHILVEDKAEANKIARRLKKASADEVDGLFGRLANRFSIDTQSAKKGGDLGTVPLGQFVPEFENTALSLGEGEIADPVQSQFGFHIIRLIEKDVVSFEDARPQILQQFPGDEAEETWRDWVLDAYRDADVDVNPRYGEFDLETQTIRAPGPEDIPGGATPTTSPAPTPTGTPAP